ncbi:hypothetical protein [Flavobacterium sp.]|uniref:hypothetical protein n=1 Tax=Flavobacterium sp. TaxID=239 RepID=UPI0037521717
MNEIISGVIGGAIVLVAQKIWDKIEHNSSTTNVSSTISQKKLPRNILEFITPGLSLEKAKEILGIPDHFYKLETEYLNMYLDAEEESNSTNILTYKFKNAIIKISSIDNLAIDSISVFLKPRTKSMIRIFANKFDSENCGFLGQMKVNDEIIDTNNKILNFCTMRERLFGLRSYYGRYGNYMNHTYFINPILDFDEIDESKKPYFFKDEIIIGYCISNSSISIEISHEEFDY